MKKLFILVLLHICSAVTNAQFYNSGNLQIHSGGNLNVAGDFLNNTGAALTNNGNLYIGGNVSNSQSSMAVGAGTLFLNGTLAQALNGTQPFYAFNLTTNNSNGITLNNNLSVSGLHTFSAGIISTSATPNYIIYESGSAYAGAADSRHVNGWVKKSGTTAFQFPVGNGTYLRNVGITNLSADAVVEARYAGTTSNPNNREAALASVNSSEHWILNKLSGGTAQVILNWDHAKVPFPNYVIPDIRTAQYGTEWKKTGGTASGTATASGSITSDPLSVFGAMVIGSETAILPVHFLNVSASRWANANRVIWKTANEMDLNHYELQRSWGNNAFNTIAIIKATNQVNDQVYQYDDAALITGKIFYRIKSVDVDGTLGYSRIVSVQVNSESKIGILQNPIKEQIRLKTTELPKAVYNYVLINTAGQVVQEGRLILEGTATIAIPLSSDISKGSYLLQITSGKSQPFTIKLIKE